MIQSTTIELTSKLLKIAEESLKTEELTASTITTTTSDHSNFTSTLLTEQHEKLATTTVINQTEILNN